MTENLKPTEVVIATAAQFRDNAIRVVQLPGFKTGDAPINVKIKSVGMMTLVGNGNLPNHLVQSVMSLFGENTQGKSESELTSKLASSDVDMVQMMSLMQAYAAATLIEPPYSEVKDYLTDDQLSGLFTHATGGTLELESFRQEPGNDGLNPTS